MKFYVHSLLAKVLIAEEPLCVSQLKSLDLKTFPFYQN